jgi:pimeloyl-ACP methyl ester carboxylesterase
MADLIPHAQLTLVAECGHMSPMEQPEAVSQWLLDWWHATT